MRHIPDQPNTIAI